MLYGGHHTQGTEPLLSPVLSNRSLFPFLYPQYLCKIRSQKKDTKLRQERPRSSSCRVRRIVKSIASTGLYPCSPNTSSSSTFPAILLRQRLRSQIRNFTIIPKYYKLSAALLRRPGAETAASFSSTEWASPWSHFGNATNVLCQLLFWGRTKAIFLSFLPLMERNKTNPPPFWIQLSPLWHKKKKSVKIPTLPS